MIDTEIKKNPIQGVQLKKARELLSLSYNEVAAEISVSPELIELWEKGLDYPNLDQLESIAALYGREVDYFLKVTADPPRRLEFRGKSDLTLKDLPKEAKMLLSKLDGLCLTAQELELLLNKKQESKLKLLDSQVNPREAATSVRQMLGIGEKPLTNLRENLEELGIRIFEFPIPEGAYSGFSYFHESYGPCILINSNDSNGRKKFTLAHELAHLIYKQGSLICQILSEKIDNGSDIECTANQFAVELLLPSSSLISDFKLKNLTTTPSTHELTPLSRKWGVSKQALGYRLENLGLIQKGHTDNLIEVKPSHFRAPKRRKTRWEKQLGTKFVSNATDSYKKGLITISKLSHILQIPIRKAIEISQQ